jgi:hypothetical protein
VISSSLADLAADAMEDDASLGQRMKGADERSDALESIKVEPLRSRKIDPSP